MANNELIKKNIEVFNEEAIANDGYIYTSDNRKAALLSNNRMSEVIGQSYDFRGKNVIDIGCGDGKYTLELAKRGAKHVLGVDPAENAVKVGRKKAGEKNFTNVDFAVLNIYDIPAEPTYDVGVIRGVLHHLPDPKEALSIVGKACDTLIIIEPNGFNPVVRAIQKFSTYHVEHETQSFTVSKLKQWCMEAGYASVESRYINLVPMLASDGFATFLKKLEGTVESIPLVRALLCGQEFVKADKA